MNFEKIFNEYGTSVVKLSKIANDCTERIFQESLGKDLETKGRLFEKLVGTNRAICEELETTIKAFEKEASIYLSSEERLSDLAEVLSKNHARSRELRDLIDRLCQEISSRDFLDGEMNLIEGRAL